ncbi:restriction endonuclease subunit S [uncultured Maribacter sp.]|uniref:restriction endonuclease subunit S n=1 Tax=uncultured Maribacter sp. TaxID=431308 RepID=UPI00261FEE72|nr:restriction endonuclease subunit S [uncultured Maribacter sp.]
MNNNWKEFSLGELCERVSVGHVGPTSIFFTDKKNGIPLIRSMNVKPGEFRQHVMAYITKEFHNKLKKSQLKSEDILIVRVGANRGDCCTVPKGIGEINCANIVFARPKNKSGYLGYFFRSPIGQGILQSLSTGAAQGVINTGSIENIKIPMPNYENQKKIATILSAYDDLIENNNQRITLLEEMAEEIYKEWFVRFRFPGYKEAVFLDKEGNKVAHGTKGAIPEGWENTQLKNHIEYYRGKSYSSAELRDDEGLAMLNLKNVNRQGGFRRDGLKYFEGKYNPNNEAYSGDIIMAVTDMTQEREIVGRVARVPDMGIDKFIISMDLIRIEPIKLPKLFTYCFFRFSGIGYQLKEFANGANVLHLTPSLIEFQKAIIPAIEICKDFEKIVEPMITEIDLLNNKNQILQETRDLLLPRLISGKLSVEELEVEEMNMAAEPQEKYSK